MWNNSKKKHFSFGALLLFLTLSGCGGESGVFKKSNQTNAMAKLRNFGTVNSIFYAERMEYSDLQGLYREGYIAREFFDAWDKNANPTPFQGYLFTDITEYSNGGPMDRHARSGLCAYPVKPGSSGDKIFLILLDDRFSEVVGGNPEEGGFASTGGSKLLAVPYNKVAGPVTRWPSDEEMKFLYEDLSRSIKRGIQKE